MTLLSISEEGCSTHKQLEARDMWIDRSDCSQSSVLQWPIHQGLPALGCHPLEGAASGMLCGAEQACNKSTTGL